MFKRFLLTAGSILAMTSAALAADPANTLTMELSTGGPVVMELRPDLAPKSAERLKELSKDGFYNGVTFHRVIDGFMAQAGDPTGTGSGGSSKPDLPAEFTATNYGRGTVGMARTSDPNSANSQFFICYEDCSFLNNQYTVVGQITAGMEFVDKLAKGEPPSTPDKILKMTVGEAAATAAAAPSPKDDGGTTAKATDPADPAAKDSGAPASEHAQQPEATATPDVVNPAAQ